jgi:hypothetical protein
MAAVNCSESSASVGIVQKHLPYYKAALFSEGGMVYSHQYKDLRGVCVLKNESLKYKLMPGSEMCTEWQAKEQKAEWLH